MWLYPLAPGRVSLATVCLTLPTSSRLSVPAHLWCPLRLEHLHQTLHVLAYGATSHSSFTSRLLTHPLRLLHSSLFLSITSR